jgi:hypothetical protein
MVDDTTSSTEEPAVDDGTVTLVSPEGVEVTAKSPVAINNLVYGKGYRLKDNPDPEAAVKAASAENAEGPETAEHADAAVGTQTEVTAVPTPSSAGAKSAPNTPKSSGKPAASGAPSTT